MKSVFPLSRLRERAGVRVRPYAQAVALLLLTNCTLVDQTTFNPQAGAAPIVPKPPIVATTATPAGPPPLLTISPNAAPAAYQAVLRKAVADARARKPTVIFDVVEMQPPDAAADTVLGAGAADVARTIVAAGILPGRVRLAARPDASATPKEIRVYVR